MTPEERLPLRQLSSPCLSRECQLHVIDSPTATVFKSGVSKDIKAPFVASFSSRGPNPVTLDILKPRISAPGVDILAAWPTISPITSVPGDKRVATYNIFSGTSMACPHATAVAAYIKSYHPKWSPAAIKSAMMTTAAPMSPSSNTQAEYAYGSGHIDPVKAINPGLVYDAGPTDYVNFLCTQNYTTQMLQTLTGDATTCPPGVKGSSHDLNYPSFALATTTPSAITPATYLSTVTNVGSPIAFYKALVTAPKGIRIQVRPPNILTFKHVGEVKSYTLTISGRFNSTVASASLKWVDGVHQVRSPIALVFVSRA